MKCEIYTTIEDIGKESWSFFAGTIPDQQYEWFQAIEHTVPWFSPRYIVVRDHGEVKALAGLNLESRYHMGNLSEHQTVKNVITTLFGPLTILESTAPHSSFSGFFLSEDRKAERECFNGLRELLKKEKAVAAVLANFYEKQPFQKYGFEEFSMSPNTCLMIQWDSFDNYLESWPPKRRHSIASSITKGEKKEMNIVYTRSFATHAEQLHQLKKNVALHHHNPGTILPCEFYSGCMDYLGEMGEMALCFKGDELVGFNFSLNKGGVCTVKFVGLDYRHREAYYFLYASAVKRGIEKGFKKMYFGRGTYTFKERLGCVRTGLFSYVKMKNPLLNPFITSALKLFSIGGSSF